MIKGICISLCSLLHLLVPLWCVVQIGCFALLSGVCSGPCPSHHRHLHLGGDYYMGMLVPRPFGIVWLLLSFLLLSVAFVVMLLKTFITLWSGVVWSLPIGVRCYSSFCWMTSLLGICRCGLLCSAFVVCTAIGWGRKCLLSWVWHLQHFGSIIGSVSLTTRHGLLVLVSGCSKRNSLIIYLHSCLLYLERHNS